MVSFVFDDGNDTDFLVGKDVFAEQGAVASTAITTDFIGTTDHLTQEQILALQGSGWEIMAHTASHPNLKSLSKEELAREFQKSNSELERIGARVTNLVYPYNKNDEAVRTVAAQYYRSARGGTNSLNSSYLDLYMIRSFSMKHDSDAMKAHIDRAWEERKWLVFYQHEINAKVKVTDYEGFFEPGETLRLSPSGTVARYVTTHWFPVYEYAIYLVPFSGTPRVGDTVRGEKSGAVARIDKIIYNQREQLTGLLGYIKDRYPQMPIVTIDQGLDILGVPKFAGKSHDKR
ncbi:MAG: polysaccharide deacetylase family protein [Geobacteraceae bacterium]|nr:polysaccharide deacetylase family protein [Geobacteraceae bacterium]